MESGERMRGLGVAQWRVLPRCNPSVRNRLRCWPVLQRYGEVWPGAMLPMLSTDAFEVVQQCAKVALCDGCRGEGCDEAEDGLF